MATSRAERNITQDLKGALPPAKSEHFAAITEPKQAAELLRAIDGYSGTFTALCALKLASLVFVRPGELRAAQWQHFDIEAKEWRYFVSKTAVQHILPLGVNENTLHLCPLGIPESATTADLLKMLRPCELTTIFMTN